MPEFEGVGFDVVVGNPPYVRADSPGNTLAFRAYMINSQRFETLAGKWDLYVPFVELSVQVLRDNGYSSLIIPDAYTHADYAQTSLNWLTTNEYLRQIDYFPGIEVFPGVGVKNVIVNSQKRLCFPYIYQRRVFHTPTEYTTVRFDAYPDTFRIDAKLRLIKPAINRVLLSDVCYLSKGIVGNSDEKEHKGEFEVAVLLSAKKDDKHPKPYYEGKDIQKWWLAKQRWIEYGTDRSPAKWSRAGFPEMFEEGPKIVAMRSPGLVPRNFLDAEQGYFNESVIGFKRWCDLKGVENRSLKSACNEPKLRAEFERVSEIYSYPFLLAILNAKLTAYELNTNRRSNIHIYPDDYRELYLPVVTIEQQTQLTALANQMLVLTEQRQTLVNQIIDLFKTDLGATKLTDKIQNWPALDWPALLDELKKQKVGVSLTKQMDWKIFYADQRAKALDLQTQRAATDRQIDELVYVLYGLTETEIALVEGS